MGTAPSHSGGWLALSPWFPWPSFPHGVALSLYLGGCILWPWKLWGGGWPQSPLGGNPSSASSSGRPWGSGCRHLPGFCFCSKAWTNPGLAQDYAVATGSPVLHVCFSDFRFADCFALYTAKAHTWPGSDKLGKKEGMEGGTQGRREWREPFAGFQSLSHA